MIRIFNIKLFFVALILFAAACEEVPNKFETEDNLVNITVFLYEHEEIFSDFIRVMENSNMIDALSSYNPNGSGYTLFLPTNDAFNRYFQHSSAYSSINDLLADQNITNAMCRYHVVNREVISNDFPLGALPDTCLTGDYLTIAYIQGEDSTYYKVNNTALVEQGDIQMNNGIIHVIDNVLEPITFSGYDWLESNEDYSIIAGLFEITGLKDTMGTYITNLKGEQVKNKYSLLVEGDSIFMKAGMNSVEDVIQEISPDNSDYTNVNNPLYQFAAYHLLTEGIFLADLKVGSDGSAQPFNYNTYASLPVQISSGLKIIVNRGVELFDSVPKGDIYEYVDYLEIFVNESNIQTSNGPVHLINRVMELYRPSRTQRTFQFYEDPVISAIRNEERVYVFKDHDELTKIRWSGTDEIVWVKTSYSGESASNKDYLYIDGDFSVSYDIPKILPGKYGLQIRANADRNVNATVQVFMDGKQVGGNVNLTTGGQNSNNPYRLINLGIIELGKYEEHTITVRSLIPGAFTWDYIRFESDMDRYN